MTDDSELDEVFGGGMEDLVEEARQKNKGWKFLEDYIEQDIDRGKREEASHTVRFEPWQNKAHRKVHEAVSKNGSTVRGGAVEYGFRLEREGILKDIYEISTMRVKFEDFFSEHYPPRVDTDDITEELDDVPVSIGAVSERGVSNNEMYVPLEREMFSDLKDLTDASNISPSELIRVLDARGLEESDVARDSEKEKARQLTGRAREITELRGPMERKIAEYVGSTEEYLAEELDRDGFELLEDIVHVMETGWGGNVEYHLDQLRGE